MVRKRRFSRFRRKRGFRQKGTWFPTLGTVFTLGDNGFNDASFSGISDAVSTSRADGTFGNPQIVHAITRDFTNIQGISTGTGTSVSLRDTVEGQTWHLDRIVGHCTVLVGAQGTTLQPDPDEYWQNLQVGAGFFLARAIENDQGFPDLTTIETDPLGAGNIQNPWIWRRTWILGNPAARTPADYYTDMPPSSNQHITGDYCGPMVDSRVKRRIPREYRLWFVIGAYGWNGDQVEVNAANVDQPLFRYNLDIRLFGRMQRARNTGQF